LIDLRAIEWRFLDPKNENAVVSIGAHHRFRDSLLNKN